MRPVYISPCDPGDCVRPATLSHLIVTQGETMGTVWRVQAFAPPGLDRPGLERAVFAVCAQVIGEMSHFEPGSVLGRFNAMQAGGLLRLPPGFARVLGAALYLAEASDGAFNPCLFDIVAARGFGPAAGCAGPVETAPPDWRALRFDRPTRMIEQAGGCRLDLSAIAKGYAVDLVADALVALGCASVLVEIGGEFAGRGLKPDGQPWWVALQPAGAGPTDEGPLVALVHGAVASSGPKPGASGAGPGHIVGLPAPGGGDPPRMISVLHRSCMMADGWATALFAAGPGKARALAEQFGIAARIAGADGAAWESPALKDLGGN